MNKECLDKLIKLSAGLNVLCWELEDDEYKQIATIVQKLNDISLTVIRNKERSA